MSSEAYLRWLERHDGLAAPVPCVCDLVEADPLDVDTHVARCRVADEPRVVLCEHLRRNAEVREAEHVELLTADRGRGQRGGGPCRLAELDDPRVGSGGLDR